MDTCFEAFGGELGRLLGRLAAGVVGLSPQRSRTWSSGVKSNEPRFDTTSFSTDIVSLMLSAKPDIALLPSHLRFIAAAAVSNFIFLRFLAKRSVWSP